MRVVVADTGPLHYLVLIGAIDILPRWFETVLLPEAVRTELSHARTPPAVRAWMDSRATWLHAAPTPPLEELPFPALDDGERAAIALAVSRNADLILMDDRGGVVAALAAGFQTIGTLGLLDRAGRHGLIGKGFGRPFKLTEHQRREAIKRPDRGDKRLAGIGRSYNVSPQMISSLGA